MCIIMLPMITKILIIAQQKIKQPNNVVSSARYWLQEQKIIANEDPLSFHHDTDDTTFPNSLIIHKEKTEEIITIGYVTLIIMKFGQLLPWISPRIINDVRSYIKHSKECFIRYLKLFKKTRLCLVFLTLFSVFGYLMKYFLVFDILLQVRDSSVLSKNSKRLNHLRLIINCTLNEIIISSQSNDLYGQTQQFQNPKEIRLWKHKNKNLKICS